MNTMTKDMVLAIMYYGKTTHSNYVEPVNVEDVLEIAYQLYPDYEFTLQHLRNALEYDFDINVTAQHIFVGGELANFQDVIDAVADITF